MKITPWIKLKIRLKERFDIDISELVNLARKIRNNLSLRGEDYGRNTEKVQNAKKDLNIAIQSFIGLFIDYLKTDERNIFNENYAVIVKLIDGLEETTIGEKANSPTHIKAFANEIEPTIEGIRLVLNNAEQNSKNKKEFFENTYKYCYANIGIFGSWARIKRAKVKIKGGEEPKSELEEIKKPSDEPFSEEFSELFEGLEE